MFNAVFYAKRYGDGIKRETMKVVVCSIEGIDYPHGFSLFILRASFFSNNPMVRISFMNRINNGLFCFNIHITEILIMVFCRNFNTVKLL